MAERKGGYTRVIKLGKRMSDSSEMCLLEWVDFVPPEAKAKGKKDAKEPKKDDKKEAKKDSKKTSKKDDKK